jgi:hypothetical protein
MSVVMSRSHHASRRDREGEHRVAAERPVPDADPRAEPARSGHARGRPACSGPATDGPAAVQEGSTQALEDMVNAMLTSAAETLPAQPLEPAAPSPVEAPVVVPPSQAPAAVEPARPDAFAGATTACAHPRGRRLDHGLGRTRAARDRGDRGRAGCAARTAVGDSRTVHPTAASQPPAERPGVRNREELRRGQGGPRRVRAREPRTSCAPRPCWAQQAGR